MFTIAAILVLALGIGANTAIFSLLNSIAYHPVGVSAPDRIVVPRVKYSKLHLAALGLSEPDFADVNTRRDLFSLCAAEQSVQRVLTDRGEATPLRVAKITSDFFDVFGVKAARGRFFRAGESLPGQDKVAVLSESLWKSRFGSDPGTLGSTIKLDGDPYLVVGIAPAEFRLPRRIDAWVPIGRTQTQMADGRRYQEDLFVVARLRAGVKTAQANGAVKLLGEQFLSRENQTEARTEGWGMFVMPFLDYNNQVLRKQLDIVAAGVAMALLIVCVNISCLMLARTTRHRAEYKLRLALGASWQDILRLRVMEASVICLAAGLIGLSLSVSVTQLFLALGPAAITEGLSVHLDFWVPSFAAGVTIIAALIFSLTPALHLLHSRVAQEGAWKSQRNRSHLPFQRALLAAQIALTLALLVAAGLLLRSFQALQGADLGFTPNAVLTVHLMSPKNRAAKPEGLVSYYETILEKLRAIPGVQSVAAASSLPLANLSAGYGSASFTIVGRPSHTGEPWPYGGFIAVSPGYAKTIGLPLRHGRFFTAADQVGAERVCVIDELLARRYWPNQDPVGQQIQRDGNGLVARIVGVVGHVESGTTEYQTGDYYYPLLQQPVLDVTLYLKTGGNPAAWIESVREALYSFDSGISPYAFRTMNDWVQESRSVQKLVSMLLAMFGAFALLIAAVGIYGTVNYSVSQRTREFGIRSALGATRQTIASLILREAALPCLIGSLLGILLAATLAGSLRHELYGIHVLDPITFLAVVLLLSATSAAAALTPAYRASRVDPSKALRHE